MSTALTWLLEGIAPIAANDARVNDVTLDSRAVRTGSLFLALPGHATHGLNFTADAVARGASVVLWEPSADFAAPHLPAGVFGAAIAGLSQLVGRIADRFFKRPSSQMRIVGITGTNGKTTCAFLLAQCLEQLGSAAAEHPARAADLRRPVRQGRGRRRPGHHPCPAHGRCGR